MTVREVADKLEATVLCGHDALDQQVEGVYIGDLLSWVMGNAPAGCAWVTVQSHINIVAVATLVGASCIIICEGSTANDDTIAKAEEEGLPILLCNMTGYQIAKKV